MINPWRVHRSRGKIVSIRATGNGGEILVNGHVLETFQDLRKFELNQEVNIQANFSICLDQYIIKTVNKIRNRN